MRQSAGVDLLGSTHGGAVVNGAASGSGEYVLKSGQNSDRVQIIVVTDVGDAEELALHFPLAVGYHRIEGLAEFLHNLAGVESVRRSDSRQRSRWGRRVELQAQGLGAGTRHLGAEFGIVDQDFAALCHVSLSHIADEFEGRSQRSK